MELDELRREIVKAARKVNIDAFNLLRWGATDAEADTYVVPTKFVLALGESRAELKSLLDKYDLEIDKARLMPSVRKRQQRALDEEMGFRPPCLTVPNETARDWEHDMCGREVQSATRPSWATDYNY